MASLKANALKKAGIKRLDVVDYREGKYLLGYKRSYKSKRGARLSSLPPQEFIELVRVDNLHFYYDQEDDRLERRLRRLEFDYEDGDGEWHVFMVDEGEIFELVH